MPPDTAAVREEYETLTATNDTNGILTCERRITITERNARESPLLLLPLEIRELIWKHVLRGTVYVTPRYTQVLFPHEMWELSKFNLLRVCKQICTESVQLSHEHSTFCFRQADLHQYPLFQKRLRGLQHVRILVHFECITDFEEDLPTSILQAFATIEFVIYFDIWSESEWQEKWSDPEWQEWNEARIRESVHDKITFRYEGRLNPYWYDY